MNFVCPGTATSGVGIGPIANSLGISSSCELIACSQAMV